MDEMQEILEEFFIEAEESLDQLEQDLIQLETIVAEGESGGETVDRIFRVLHTLKGGAGFLGLEKMAKLAHAGENLLDEVRSGSVKVTTPVMDALLETNDALKNLMSLYRAQDDVDSVDNSALIARLEVLVSGEEPATPVVEAPAAEPVVETEAPVIEENAAAPAIDPSLINQELLAEVQGDDILDPSRDKDNQAAVETVTSSEDVATPSIDPSLINQELLAEVQGDDVLDPARDKDNADNNVTSVAAESAAAPAIDPSLINQELLAEVQGDDILDPSRDKDNQADTQSVMPASSAPEPEAQSTVAQAVAEAPLIKRGESSPQAQEQRGGGDDRRQGTEDRRKTPRRAIDPQETIRVETHRLDKVMNLVGELVLARNSLVRQLDSSEVQKALDGLEAETLIATNMEHLSRVTKDLQMSVLSTRMQPIKKVFDKIPRQVRELKTQLGREVNLVIEGEMTEVDKSLVEDLSDPMVHMVRNALDHGIELPEVREELGKPREGTLRVSAFYEGNNVVIQVAEDGKGIDPVKIREIAVKKGVVTESVANAMSDQEAIRLIMAPGFSTAEVISDVSGRGVGMDVVNSKIAEMSGTLDIKSELGQGTTFSIYLPLTLAIVNALVVDSNNEGFAVPIGDISEVIKFAPDEIHKMNEQDVIELRGEALPLFYLSKLTRRGFLPPVKLPKEKLPEVNPVDEQTLSAVQSKDMAELSLDDLDMVATAESYNAATSAEKMAKVGKNSLQRRTQGFVVVVKDGTSSMGLVVDKLLGQEEAVVKPVTDLFEYNKAISGATITGDGTVHMILDVPFMIKQLTQN